MDLPAASFLDQEEAPAHRIAVVVLALDVERDGGMAVFLGRVRPCPVFDYKFVALGHNTVRGAAGAAVLNAELMLAEKLID